MEQDHMTTGKSAKLNDELSDEQLAQVAGGEGPGPHAKDVASTPDPSIGLLMDASQIIAPTAPSISQDTYIEKKGTAPGK